MNLGGVDLNLLIALEALLSEKNVTRAAERTSVGQSAMSASLARLRKHFDDPLLVRQGRQLVLTPLAESLVRPVGDAVEKVEAVMGSRTAFDPATDARSFTIVASDYVTLVLLRPLLAELVTDSPWVRVNIVPVPLDFADQLRRGQVDLLIMPTAIVGNQPFPHRTLFSERFVLACARNNVDITDHVTSEEFARLPYLSYSLGPLISLGELGMEEAGIERRTEVRTESLVLAPFLLTDTRLVSLMHERLARMMAEPAGLRILEPPTPLNPIVEAMFWDSRNTGDAGHRWLRTRIDELAAGMR
jgi:DNA-binding transcriptional LysR family regulator